MLHLVDADRHKENKQVQETVLRLSERRSADGQMQRACSYRRQKRLHLSSLILYIHLAPFRVFSMLALFLKVTGGGYL